MPLAEGGEDDDDNLQTLCQACDKTKTAQEARRGRG
ncbi:MAG: HNH endonuclease [Candidatus Reddybacter sp.]